MKNAVLLKFNSLKGAKLQLSHFKKYSGSQYVTLAKAYFTGCEVHDPKVHNLDIGDGCAGVLVVFLDNQYGVKNANDLCRDIENVFVKGWGSFTNPVRYATFTGRIELHDCVRHNGAKPVPTYRGGTPKSANGYKYVIVNRSGLSLMVYHEGSDMFVDPNSSQYTLYGQRPTAMDVLASIKEKYRKAYGASSLINLMVLPVDPATLNKFQQ